MEGGGGGGGATLSFEMQKQKFLKIERLRAPKAPETLGRRPTNPTGAAPGFVRPQKPHKNIGLKPSGTIAGASNKLPAFPPPGQAGVGRKALLNEESGRYKIAGVFFAQAGSGGFDG